MGEGEISWGYVRTLDSESNRENKETKQELLCLSSAYV